ncbi:GNAT family N-acetyltransferase [Candidatus Woesearchaeota archaeon]|nr:GNAT family N-acetyltransferase [Candidatus Woesearchaeota archaeon]
MRYNIFELKKEDFEEWDSFVKENKLPIFHTISWKKILEETFNFKPVYYIVKDKDGQIVGVSPAFICKTFLKKIIVSMPFFEYGGPFVKKGYKEAYKDIFERYKEYADKGKVDHIKIRSLPFEEDYQDINFKKELEAYDFYMDIEGRSFEDIWNSFSKDQGVRTEVNKAKRKGVIVKTENSPDVLHKLLTMKDARLGSPSFSKRFYLNIEKYLKDNTNYITSYINKTPIASMISLRFQDELMLHQLGSDPEYFKKTSTDILFIEQIRYAIENNLKKVDFGRSKPNSSHSFFKKKYNCKKRDIYVYSYPLDFSEQRYEGRNFGQKIIKKIPWVFTRTFLGNWLRKNVGL